MLPRVQLHEGYKTPEHSATVHYSSYRYSCSRSCSTTFFLARFPILFSRYFFFESDNRIYPHARPPRDSAHRHAE